MYFLYVQLPLSIAHMASHTKSGAHLVPPASCRTRVRPLRLSVASRDLNVHLMSTRHVLSRDAILFDLTGNMYHATGRLVVIVALLVLKVVIVFVAPAGAAIRKLHMGSSTGGTTDRY